MLRIQDSRVLLVKAAVPSLLQVSFIFENLCASTLSKQHITKQNFKDDAHMRSESAAALML